MKKSVRRIISSVLALGVSASIVVAAIAPLLSPPVSVAQTNPQTTDIFTGQFIPAYYGAAYDPSEAYKHMAGATIYVFAYDTWGAVVNNFAYKTQIRADGSFQAAGMPNASHYGIFYPDNANYLTNYFRTPRENDNLQATFAYQQAVFPDEEGQEVPNTQIPGEKVPDEMLGGRVFLTSSKNVDIRNHINIFPLVPTNVLSVIIKDSWSDPDFANINKPYEIYAQRVATKALTDASSTSCGTNASFETRQACSAEAKDKSFKTNGPVIRGRTVFYTPQKEDGSPCGSATIFQAFAPAGTYAITYWRPDGRDAENQITYLNYNGTQPLNSTYNGIAVEVADIEAGGTGEDLYSLWGDKSSRCTTEPDELDNENYWPAYANGSSIWGMLYQSNGGRVQIAAGAATVSISDQSLVYVNPSTRKCDEGGANSGNVGTLGIYIFSSCGKLSSPVDTSISIQDGQSTSNGGGAADAGNAAANALNAVIRPNLNIEVSVNSSDGPSRKDVNLTTFSTDGAQGQLVIDGQPIRNTWLSMVVNGHLYNEVARTDENGFFVIGKNYFRPNERNDYRVIVHGNLGTGGYQEFTIDGSSMAMFSDGNLQLGAIAMDKDPDPVGQFLASLDLTKFFDRFRIQPALAAYGDQVGVPWTVNPDPFSREEWVFYIDSSALFGQQESFTPTNYDLTHADIKVPPQYEALDNCTDPAVEGQSTQECNDWRLAAMEGLNVDDGDFDQNDNLFERNVSASNGPAGGVSTGDEDVRQGMVTPDGDANQKIIAVALQPKDEFADNIGDMLIYFDKLLGPDPVMYNLRVRFEYIHDEDNEAPEASENNTTTGQKQASTPPEVLTANWPVFISVNEGGGFDVTYDPVQLVPAEGDICKDTGFFTGMVDRIESFLCNAVLGGISAIKSVFDFLAGYILVVDPLSFSTVTHFWNMIRNIMNSMAIFILVAAGVAIMMRYEPSVFNIKSVITKLIVAIVLINFSILIVQVAIDVTNVIAYGGYRFLVNSIDQGNIGGSGLAAAGASLGALGVAALGTMIAATGGIGAVIGVLIFFLALVLFFGYVVIRIGIDYAFRMAALWICIILSPAAFASRAMPGTQKYYGRWKGLLLGTLVAQITVALMIALALGMLKIGVAENGFWNSLLTLLLAFALFYYATIAPRKVAAMVGEDLSAGLESMTKKGLVGAWGLGQKQKLSNARRRELKKERKESGQPRGIKGAYQRFRVKQGYVGLSGMALGVKPEDMDKIESETRSQAQGEKSAFEHSRFGDISKRERIESHEENRKKISDTSAASRKHTKITDARSNLNMVDSPTGNTTAFFDPVTGEEIHQVGDMGMLADAAGNPILDADGNMQKSYYSRGFDKAWEETRKNGGESGKRAYASLREYVGTNKHLLQDGKTFDQFFSGYQYGNKSGKDAWIQMYGDAGEYIDPKDNMGDIKGKIWTDVVVLPARRASEENAAVKGWGQELDAASKSKGAGWGPRDRVQVSEYPELNAERAAFATAALMAPAEFQISHNPASGYIYGKNADEAVKAIQMLNEAYTRGPAFGFNFGTDTTPRKSEVANAVRTLKRLKYS